MPRADATRGRSDARFVEGIDVVPTIVEALGIAGSPHRVEGRSLLPLLRAESPPHWRDAVFAELDYGFRRARQVLGRGVRDCRAFMVRTADWKYVHWEGFRAQLFDLAADPLEQCDLGVDPRYEAVRVGMRERLFDWLAACKRRTTVDDAAGRGAHRRAPGARDPHRHLVTRASGILSRGGDDRCRPTGRGRKANRHRGDFDGGTHDTGRKRAAAAGGGARQGEGTRQPIARRSRTSFAATTARSTPRISRAAAGRSLRRGAVALELCAQARARARQGSRLQSDASKSTAGSRRTRSSRSSTTTCRSSSIR